MKTPQVLIIAAALISWVGLGSAPARAFDDVFAKGEVHTADQAPLTLQNLKDIPPGKPLEDQMGPPIDIRKEALKEAALSLGARAGLAARTYEIRRELKSYDGYLDRVFDFRQLLIAAPSGLMIEPPIISEADDALIIDGQGLKAAVADKILNIGVNARIVTAPRTWRTYLEREWGDVELPPDLLRPKTNEERAEWKKNVEIGWAEGYGQADDTFEQDVARLLADFNGMVRYRRLLAQGMVSAPFALQTDRGVTGGGSEMRIGDRAVQITGLPELVPGVQQWSPASR